MHGVRSLLLVRGTGNGGTIAHPSLAISSPLSLSLESGATQCKPLGCGSAAGSRSISECTVTWLAAGSV